MDIQTAKEVIDSFHEAKRVWERLPELPEGIAEASTGLAKRRKKSSDTAFERLLSAYRKLEAAVKANYGGANKDLNKFTDQILNLYNKWMR